MVYSDEINVKGSAVRTIIGLQGTTIRKLQEEFNVRMKFLGPNDVEYVERTLEIIGAPCDVENAKRRVVDIMEGNEEDYFTANGLVNGNGVAQSQQSISRLKLANYDTPLISEEFLVPSAVAHLVLGRDAENLKNIKKLQNLRYAEAESIRITDDGREMRQVVLRGTAENIENTVKLLKKLVETHSQNDATRKFVNNNDTKVPLFSKTGAVRRNANERRENIDYSDQRHRVPEGEIVSLMSASINSGTNGVNSPTHSEIPKLAERVGRLGEQYNSEMERVSRTHCDGIVKASLEFVARAECEMANELASLREQLANARAQLEEARVNPTNGGSALAVEIAELKKQVRLKDSQLDGLLVENSHIKANNEDLVIEVATLKSQLQNSRLISLDDLPALASTNLCKNCGKEPRDAVIMPCLHLTHCKLCADALTRCEVCNAKVQTRLKIKVDKHSA